MKLLANLVRKQLLFIELLVLLTILWLLAACGDQAGPIASEQPIIGDPQVSATTPQEPGEEVGISIDVSNVSGVTLTYEWSVDGGEIVRGQGSPAITYRAPDEPGIYNVRVTTRWGSNLVEKVTSIKVETSVSGLKPEPLPATPTPRLTNTPTPKLETVSVPNQWDAVVSATFASIRRRPELSAQSLISLNKGDNVDLIAVSEDGQWVQGHSHGRTGWLPVDKLRLNISLNILEVKTVAAKPTVTPKSTSTPRPAPEPTATIDADPSVYDNFNNPANDGIFNQSQWRYWGELSNQIFQRDGILITTLNEESGNRTWTTLAAQKYSYTSLDFFASGPTFFEAKLMLDPTVRGQGNIQLHISADDLGGVGSWFVECGINEIAWANCYNSFFPFREGHFFDISGKQVGHGEWHTFRIEINPDTMTVTYYIDGQLGGSHTPPDANLIKTGKFTVGIGNWRESTDGIITGYIDDVRIGPVGQ